MISFGTCREALNGTLVYYSDCWPRSTHWISELLRSYLPDTVSNQKLHLYPTGARAETESRTRYLTRYHFILLNMGSMEMFCWISSGHIEIISLLYRSWIGKRYKTQTLFVPNHTAPKNSLHLTNWSLYVH